MRNFSDKLKGLLLCLIIAIWGIWLNNTEILSDQQKNTSHISRLATGNITGNYYSYGMDLAKQLSENTNMYLTVTPTAGSVENIRLIEQNACDLAIVQSDVLSAAINGSSKFAGEPHTGFHPLRTLFTEDCQIIVPADSSIRFITDLSGKRVAVGEQDSGTRRSAEIILAACGIDLANLQTNYLSFEEATAALKRGDIDALFVTAKAPVASIAMLFKQYPVRLLSLSPALCQQITELYHDYKVCTIPAGTYYGQTQAVNTIASQAVLIARNDFPKDKEAKLLSFLDIHSQDLTRSSIGNIPSQQKNSLPVVSLNMYLTAALAVIVLFFGRYLQRKISFLNTFCVPAPVIGGLIFAIFSAFLYACNIAELQFDETLKNIGMIAFFTSVGFQVNLKLHSGGKHFTIFLFCVIILIFCQNIIALTAANLLEVSPLIGMCTGSIPMIGGHGTAGAFSIVLESMGLDSALTLSTAAATFGLFSGSLIGGPIARRLITKNDLLKTVVHTFDNAESSEQQNRSYQKDNYCHAIYALAIAMGFGTLISAGLNKLGMTFPVYIGSMLIATVLRNFCEFSSGKYTLCLQEISDIGNICLSIFLGIAMISMKLWQIAALAIPLFIMLLAQVIFMAVYAYFVIFRVCGQDYDAAIMAAGACGFGLGATPNAMANMQALTEKFGPSIKAFLIVPIVGSMFVDFINSLVITLFLNLL